MNRASAAALIFTIVWPCLYAACAGPVAEGSAASSAGPGGAGGAESGCSDELCAPYACDLRFNACRTTCAGVLDCVAGHLCEGGFCVGTECTEETAEARCGGYACVKGTCSPDCALGPCADGYYCRGDENRCVPRCTSRGDPRCAGYVCAVDFGECESYCFTGGPPCAAGYACDGADACAPDESAPRCAEGCGAFACVAELGRCATHCVEDDDCVAPAVCVSGACKP